MLSSLRYVNTHDMISAVKGDSSVAQRIDETVSTHAYRILSLSPKVLLIYLSHRSDNERRSSLWHILLRETAQHDESLPLGLSALVDLAQAESFSGILRPSRNELDPAVAQLFVTSSRSTNDAQSYTLLKRVLQNPGAKFSVTTDVACLTRYIPRSLHIPGLPHWCCDKHLLYFLATRSRLLAR